ncbi:uncharacterized protein E0L32_007994 [Thyridium curvatum]|uniref:Uncharacterized protein n=1 Tax=Thyridium curvatum TaxID=1093900 RepID=A0A507ATR6_9PEZI|nr:uncharacterized protein E0L32_007994 [Thyridium curvatum]TPX11133.1 hypothetical protein E0L32_007994 [Thyridium curvatum]
MIYTAAALASLAALAQGLVIRDGCTFHLDVDGTPVGQVEGGQAKFGNGLKATNFVINGDVLSDGTGRGCWWTPPTKVLQCDAGQAPTSGFGIACDGTFSYKGQTQFFKCESGDGLWNIYLEDGHGQNCGPISLRSDGCHADCAPPPPPPPPAPKCPVELTGSWEFPHLIVPVDSANPDKASGTSYDGNVSPTVSSIFNFDIPAGDAGKTCQLVFLLPKKEDLETSDYKLSGSGALDFVWLNGVANLQTTYNNAPGAKMDLGTVTVAPGNSYAIANFDCPAGQTISFEIKEGGGADTNLWYFQDYNPSPIGLYITKC